MNSWQQSVSIGVAALGCLAAAGTALAQPLIPLYWPRRHEGPLADVANDIAAVYGEVAGAGNVYVTGQVGTAAGQSKFGTWKYLPNGAIELPPGWSAISTYPNTGDFDAGVGLHAAKAVAVWQTVEDPPRDVITYVTGQSPGPGTGMDYVVIKYLSNGERDIDEEDGGWPEIPGVSPAGTRRYNNPDVNGDDIPAAVAVFHTDGSVFVTGTSMGRHLGSDGVVRITQDYFTTGWTATGEIHSRFPAANEPGRFNGTGNGNDVATDIGVIALSVPDGGGPVIYVTGRSRGGLGHDDCVTLRYHPGTPILALTVDRGGDDGGNAFVPGFDSTGELAYVFVVGYTGTPPAQSFFGPGDPAEPDYMVVSYDGDGNRTWLSSLPDTSGVMVWDAAGGFDVATSATIGSNSNASEFYLYVTGRAQVAPNQLLDIATLRVDPDTGIVLWARSFHGGGDDRGVGVAFGNTLDAYVAGSSVRNGARDYVALRYTLDGVLAGGPFYYDGPGGSGGDDTPTAAIIHPTSVDIGLLTTGGSVGSGTGQDFATTRIVFP